MLLGYLGYLLDGYIKKIILDRFINIQVFFSFY